MARVRKPRRGSMQFWPRKRSRHTLARIRSWANEKTAKPQGFIGYKVGMTHVMINDNNPRSITKGEQIAVPATIVECPPLTIAGVSFYKKSLLGLKKVASILAPKLNKELGRKIQLPKKQQKSIDDITDFEDLRIFVHSNPKLTTTGVKKPKVLEISLGGSKEEKLNFVKENLGKDISVNDIFTAGNYVDVHGITKGKGFQGTVKRYGVPIRQHKAEKTKRGIGNLGSWTPKHVQFSVPQPGKMGYHLRTEYNKQLLKLSSSAEEIVPDAGFRRYGVIKNPYVLIRGSIVGPKQRAVVLSQSIRSIKKTYKEIPDIDYIKR